MNRKSNLTKILHDLIQGQKLTSIDRNSSNTNQYFKTIKDNGIHLVEEWKPNQENQGRHKERSLHRDHDNVTRAKKFLLRLENKNKRL